MEERLGLKEGSGLWLRKVPASASGFAGLLGLKLRAFAGLKCLRFEWA